MPGAVQVEQHAVVASPFGHRLDGGIADGQVDHHHHRAQFGGEIRPLVHLFHGSRGDVEVVPLDLTGCRLGTVDRFHAEQEPVAPPHERLRVDVLVVLGEVQAAAQGLVHHAAIVARRQAQLGFGGRAQQRSAELAQILALHDDAVRGPLKRLDVMRGNPHILQSQRLERLEPEHVADDRTGEVGDRPLLEQVDVIGDQRDPLPGGIGHRLDAVALRLVVLEGGEPVGPHHGPCRGTGFTGDGRTGFLGRHTVLGGNPEGAQHI